MCFGFSAFFELNINYKVWITSDYLHIEKHKKHVCTVSQGYYANTSPTTTRPRNGTLLQPKKSWVPLSDPKPFPPPLSNNYPNCGYHFLAFL